jgi:hypothetical protein
MISFCRKASVPRARKFVLYGVLSVCHFPLPNFLLLPVREQVRARGESD